MTAALTLALWLYDHATRTGLKMFDSIPEQDWRGRALNFFNSAGQFAHMIQSEGFARLN